MRFVPGLFVIHQDHNAEIHPILPRFFLDDNKNPQYNCRSQIADETAPGTCLKSYTTATLLLLFAISLAKHLGNWATFLITENSSSAIDIRLSAITTASSVFIEWLQNAALVVLCLILLSPKRTLENPVKVTSLSVCGMMVLLNVVSRIALDVEYGAPSSTAEVWVMIAYYLFDILLYGVVGHFIMKGLLRKKHSEPLSEE